MVSATSQRQTQSAQNLRADIFAKLERRNSFISFLRFGVPALGLALIGFLIFQIFLANIAKEYGISSLQLDKEQVVIDGARYGGVTDDGTIYQIIAEKARVQVNNTDIIDLEMAKITIDAPDGYQLIATAPIAQMDMARQTVLVTGVLYTIDSDNVIGELNNTIIDWPTQVLTASGPVRFEFADGAIINAQSLVYDASIPIWEFGKTIYNVPGDGGL